MTSCSCKGLLQNALYRNSTKTHSSESNEIANGVIRDTVLGVNHFKNVMLFHGTVHVQMELYLRPQEKYVFHCAYVHKTPKYSVALRADLLPIFNQIGSKDKLTDALN